ncbi:hypothetical protein PHLCEN_2v8645 [Hermanssonia centrifuga]|uniref:Thioester reductase (TE) domain-containing protein n=1 Tax=Hermanssonia centrifuga TaxID=98765 RepID=A0A2R6NT19_9APHY|nr:hypothetical protein PHLCEN_2v8645 [Hermanssonia centrifuga]
MTTCPTKTVLIDKHSAISAMKLMVDKYSIQFPTHKPCENPTSVHHDTLVITGTTGSLGAALLAELMVAPNVAHIYAINRKSQKPLLERQMEAFQRMGLANAVIQPSTNVTFIEANMQEENLGLEPEILHKIRKSATHIIHNAWPVNFNLSLQFFDQNVRSLRNLIDLALSSHHASPPRLIFISSVGVLRHACPSLPVKEGPVDPEIAVGSGYSESKWVAEKLLDEAASRSALRPLVVRVGQLSGSRSGAWKETEWFPSLIQSSVYLKCFPAVDKEISWLPTEDAARALVETKNTDVRYLHLAHPHPVNWSTIANPIATELDLPLVPYTEWLSLLTKSRKGLESKIEQEVVKVNSALKLLDFFTQISLAPESREMAMPRLDLSQARSNSPALNEVKPLSADIALKWISYWRHSGFLPLDSAVLS